MSFDPSMVVSTAPTEICFRMVGYNNPLNYAGKADLQPVVLYLGYALDGLFLLQLFASMALHRMIGLETMQIAQTVFFVRYLLQDSGPMAVYNLCSLSLINGYNPFASYANVRDLDGVTMRLGLGKHFLFNVIPQVVLILLAWLARLTCSRKVSKLRRHGAENSYEGIEAIKKVLSLELKFADCVFILTAYSCFLFSFAVLTAAQPQEELEYSLPRIVLLATLLIVYYAVGYLTGRVYLDWKRGYDEEVGLLNKYVSVFVAYQMLLPVLLIGLAGFGVSLEILGGVQLTYTLYLIAARPYFLRSQNVLLVLSQSGSLAFTGLLVVEKFLALPEQFMVYAVLGFEGLLGLVSLTGFLRLWLHRRFNERAFKLLHLKEEKIAARDAF
jgi:hypothetical protein